MRSSTLTILAIAAAVSSADPLLAGQTTQPAAGCTATAAQLDANKKVAVEFFRPGITPEQRTALLDQSYVQHNPVFKKFADENKLSYYEGFRQMMAANAARGRAAGPAGQASPPPPAGNALEIVMAECDLVTVIHRNARQDPTAAPGTWFEAFTFDTFRVRNGKLVEHWDTAVITPPAPPGAVGRGGVQ